MGFVMCYICGREFGSASISIHIPNCEKKWELEQSKLPKKQRRPCPTRPNDFERVISGELKGQDLKTAMLEYNNQAFDDFNKKALVKCKNCDRTFLPRPLEIHQRSCRPKPEGNSQAPVVAKPSRERRYLKTRSTSPGKTAKSRIPVAGVGAQPIKEQSTTIQVTTPSPPVIRPGTYKKTEEKENIACASADPPTREDIIARIEKDIAFADPKVCTELMEFIIDLTREP